MGNTTDNQRARNNGFKKPKSFRMAYSLDNEQPVLCTMISDQPFFYMDEEEIFEEDAILSGMDDENHDYLTEELLTLKDKMDAYERVSSEFVQEIDERLEGFIENSFSIAEIQTVTDAQETLKTIKDILVQSRMASSLLANAEANDVTLEISNQVENISYDRKSKKIFVRADLNFVDQILLTVQELRRHWQHSHGALVHPLTFHPDQAVLINRAQLADLSTAIVRCAWEFKLQGLKDIWARVEHSSLSDLGRALAREALSDFRTLNNGKASAAVFETWFLSERCRHQDKKLIQAMLADYRGYVFDDKETSKMVSIDLICALGEQPFGKNYLASYAQMILNDAVFTDIRDRANANFLWFIKFERSFAETEQELQSSDLTNKSGPTFNEAMTNNEIFEDTDNATSKGSKARLRADILGDNADRQHGGNVIHIQFGSDNTSREGISS